jgi:hypothetical protein
MYYFFVTIQYNYNSAVVIFSTIFKSDHYMPKAEMIEKAFMKTINDHFHVGYSILYDLIHENKSQIIFYNTLTKKQYDQYKKDKIVRSYYRNR